MLNHDISVIQAKKRMVEAEETACSPYYLKAAFQNCCNEFNTVATVLGRGMARNEAVVKGLYQLCLELNFIPRAMGATHFP